MTDPVALRRPASPAELFWGFTWLALQGFGGVLAVAQRELCEKRRWLTKAQFLEFLTVGQVLPGPNICNVAMMIGDRFFGWRGAFAALFGMMTLPLVIVMALAVLYVEFAANPLVAGALRGMGAVAAGLIIGTGLKLAPALRQSPLGIPACVAIGIATFVLVALLRVSLLWVLLGLGALGCAAAWVRLRRSAAAEDPPRADAP
ncbi:MAG: chromate transporter [Casimicrobiaceae bacterium]